jgi:hypothetical protein
MRDDRAFAITFYHHQSYPQVIELSKRQETTEGWRILLCLTYEKTNRIEDLEWLIQSMEQSTQDPSEKVLSQYMKHKHFSTKDILLQYLRRDILDANLPTDDYLVNDFIMMDAQQIFSKSQFYKEASQLMVNFYRRMNQIQRIELNLEDED